MASMLTLTATRRSSCTHCTAFFPRFISVDITTKCEETALAERSILNIRFVLARCGRVGLLMNTDAIIEPRRAEHLFEHQSWEMQQRGISYCPSLFLGSSGKIKAQWSPGVGFARGLVISHRITRRSAHPCSTSSSKPPRQPYPLFFGELRDENPEQPTWWSWTGCLCLDTVSPVLHKHLATSCWPAPPSVDAACIATRLGPSGRTLRHEPRCAWAYSKQAAVTLHTSLPGHKWCPCSTSMIFLVGTARLWAQEWSHAATDQAQQYNNRSFALLGGPSYEVNSACWPRFACTGIAKGTEASYLCQKSLHAGN